MKSVVSRLTLLVVAGMVVSSVGVGTVWSYLRAAHGALGKSLRDAVPIEFELKRVRQMTDDLIPEFRTNQKIAAQLDVEIDYLDRDVHALRQTQALAREQMRKLREALNEHHDSFTFGGKKFSRTDIEHDLALMLERFDEAEKQLAEKERILDARRQTLVAATDKIRQFQQQQELLAQKVESLKAELKLAELAEESGSFQFDNSKLAQAKEAVEQAEKRIRVMQKLVEGERQVAGEVPVEADSRPVSQKYDEYFKIVANPDNFKSNTPYFLALKQSEIKEGVGCGDFRVGASKDELVRILGNPQVDSTATWLRWNNAHHVDCLLGPGQKAMELRFNDDFPYALASGIRIGSTEAALLAAYGQPAHRVVKGTAKKLEWSTRGLLVWTHDGKVSQIVCFTPADTFSGKSGDF